MEQNYYEYPEQMPSVTWMQRYVAGDVGFGEPVPCQWANWAAKYLGLKIRFKINDVRFPMAITLIHEACEKYLDENHL